MYNEIRDKLKERQAELFSWKAQLESSVKKFCGNIWGLWEIRSIVGEHLKKKKCILKMVTARGLISFIPGKPQVTQSVQK